MTVSGPAQVARNSGAQYTRTAHCSDGSSSNVTGDATWAEDSDDAAIHSTGYLPTDEVFSEEPCTLTATYGGRTDTHGITITFSSPAEEAEPLTSDSGGGGGCFTSSVRW